MPDTLRTIGLESAIAWIRTCLAGSPQAVDRPLKTSHPPLEHLVETLGLSPFERDVLILAAAQELDPQISSLCAQVSADPGAAHPTFGLALACLPDAHWSALAPAAPLRRWRLVEVGTGRPLIAAPLRIDERVLHYLLGDSALDERLAVMVEPLEPTAMEQLVPSHAALARLMLAAWSKSAETMPAVMLCGDSADCRPIAAASAAAAGFRAAVLPTYFVPHSAIEVDAFARLWEREVALGGFGVLFIEADDVIVPGDDDAPRSHAVDRLIERLSVPAVVRERERRRVNTRPTIIFEVNHPLPKEQAERWRAAAIGVGYEIGDTDPIVAQFDLSVPAIERLANEAAALATASGPAAYFAAIAWDRSRAYLRASLDGLAERIDSRVGWEDLVLPDEQVMTLHAIAAQLRQRMTVYDRWGFAARSARGLGISALFSGPSGTGKTMAAEVLAGALDLDLYRIDLASAVSKYIGETEKNLRRVFDAAEDSGAILLFDEADALFGKRTEVRDSHDRYANIEVSYLLQQMEAYRGLAILTTNLKSALDTAFLRRLRFVVHFPFPDATQRAEIWRRTFPANAPLGMLDYATLANLTISGGNIRNIGLNAAFLAADDKTPISMAHVLAAARSEYTKLDRHLSAAEVETWS